MRDEFKEEIKFGLEVERVPAFHKDPHDHLGDSEDYSEFHFERIDECEFVGAAVPNGIQA